MCKLLVILMYCGGNGLQAGPSSNETEHEIITSQRGKFILLRAEEEPHIENAEQEAAEEVDEEILDMIKEHGLEDIDELTFEIEKNDAPSDDYAEFVKSSKGKTLLQFNDFLYKKAYKSKLGIRWICANMKDCPAFVYLNDNDEIVRSFQEHYHDPIDETANAFQKDTAVVITSRKGKEMLLFRQYTYRKQYDKGDRVRWVCSTLKNCKACVFTNSENHITSASFDHCHNPPKYYLKPNHVLEALREPLILKAD